MGALRGDGTWSKRDPGNWWGFAWRNGGWPAIFLLVIFFMAWRTAAWAEPKASRVIESHLDFVEASIAMERDNGTRLDRLVSAVEIQAQQTTSLLRELEEHRAWSRTAVERIEQAVKKP